MGRTPHRAIALQGIWASVLAFTGSYRVLFTRVIYTEWIFSGLMALGLVVLRRRGSGSYWTPWYPFVPVANEVSRQPIESLTRLGLVLAGLPVYFGWVRQSFISDGAVRG